MKKFSILFLSFFTSLLAFSQGEIKGTLKDASTGETVIGATVTVAEGKAAITDLNGNYSIKVDDGTYNVVISYVGFETQKFKVKVTGKPVVVNASLAAKTLNEVEIVADVAKTRETPVAFSTISAKHIEEELGSRDLPMLLNSTPGAYATEQGGGSGDSRVNIRGFDQRNVAVMVDGVPVNDMENGWVYWSNWDGLGDITRSMQVQRGLGASKLAISAVGGTMNIITKGIDQKKEISIKQEVMSDLTYKTSLGFNTGQLKGGWGITGAATRKVGDGYIDQTWVDAYSYFLKAQKRMGKHLLSLSGSGAPQSHGQRSIGILFPYYDKEFSEDLGINADSVLNVAHTSDFGRRYNQNWGFMNEKAKNVTINYFHKPQLNLSHFWNINKKLYLSTVAYASFGKGGGTKLVNAVAMDKTTGQLDLEALFRTNAYNIDPLYSTTEHKSTNVMQSSINNHYWYGVLSSLSYQIDTAWSALIGIDARYYKGIHYKEVYDLMGGDYYENHSDPNQPTGQFFGDPNFQYQMKHKGDRIFTNYEGYVTWGGAFGQLEYKKKKWSAFVTGSLSETGYQRKDYFKKKDLILSDTVWTQAVGFGDTVTYNGVKYTSSSPEAKTSETEKKWFKGYTAKAGANYNISEHHNVFVNAGYLKMPPKFDLVFTSANEENTKVKMQEVVAVELGYGYRERLFAANLNLYYTDWKNKPISEFPTIRIASNDFYYTTNGLDELHKGIELDFTTKMFRNIEIQGLASVGDWTVNSSDEVYLFDINTDKPYDTVQFSAQGVHTGDAAQIQLGGSVRYEPVKHLYFKLRYTYFSKNYSKYNLLDLQLVRYPSGAVKSDNRDRESWKMPDYSLLDLYAGYNFNYMKLRFSITAGVTNVLNTVYISDAMNNYSFDATTATGFIGMGTRFNAGLKVTF
jgi:outer membrane cobalamin receptor